MGGKIQLRSYLEGVSAITLTSQPTLFCSKAPWLQKEKVAPDPLLQKNQEEGPDKFSCSLTPPAVKFAWMPRRPTPVPTAKHLDLERNRGFRKGTLPSGFRLSLASPRKPGREDAPRQNPSVSFH